MRQTLFTAAAAFIAGGIATGAVLSHAQPSSPPSEQMDGDGHGFHHWMHRHHAMGQGRPFSPRDFALIYRQPDRQLTPPDVQKIAEAFLLWNGNHTWKVTNVTPAADGPINFSLTTPEGSVVAQFTIDPHSGHVQRSG